MALPRHGPRALLTPLHGTSTGLTDAAFAHPGIDTVEIHHDEANAASAGVPKKLGFTLARKALREPTAPAETGVEWQWTMGKRDWT